MVDGWAIGRNGDGGGGGGGAIEHAFTLGRKATEEEQNFAMPRSLNGY